MISSVQIVKSGEKRIFAMYTPHPYLVEDRCTEQRTNDVVTQNIALERARRGAEWLDEQYGGSYWAHFADVEKLNMAVDGQDIWAQSHPFGIHEGTPWKPEEKGLRVKEAIENGFYLRFSSFNSDERFFHACALLTAAWKEEIGKRIT